MNSEKVKEIKELLRCMNGEKACTNCYINEIAQEQETCCINIVADMTLDLINELESENKELKRYKMDWLNSEKMHLQADLEDTEFELNSANRSLQEVREENQQLKDQIAELEKHAQNMENEVRRVKQDRNRKDELASKFIDSYNDSLKQFAERLKEKVIRPCDLYDCVTLADIDETLKEFINE